MLCSASLRKSLVKITVGVFFFTLTSGVVEAQTPPAQPSDNLLSWTEPAQPGQPKPVVMQGQIQNSDILYVGDSHSYGCFGSTLDQGLRSIPGSPRVTSIATCGSAASSWLNAKGNSTTCGFRYCDTNGTCTNDKVTHGGAPFWGDILPQAQPRLTIIELGTNMLSASKTALPTVLQNVSDMIGLVELANSQCIWIGPPQAGTGFVSVADYNSFVCQLGNQVRSLGCEFVDSGGTSQCGNIKSPIPKTNRNNLLLTDDRGKLILKNGQTQVDPMGIHYGCDDAANWAKQVYSELLKNNLSSKLQP